MAHPRAKARRNQDSKRWDGTRWRYGTAKLGIAKEDSRFPARPMRSKDPQANALWEIEWQCEERIYEQTKKLYPQDMSRATGALAVSTVANKIRDFFLEADEAYLSLPVEMQVRLTNAESRGVKVLLDTCFDILGEVQDERSRGRAA